MARRPVCSCRARIPFGLSPLGKESGRQRYRALQTGVALRNEGQAGRVRSCTLRLAGAERHECRVDSMTSTAAVAIRR